MGPTGSSPLYNVEGDYRPHWRYCVKCHARYFAGIPGSACPAAMSTTTLAKAITHSRLMERTRRVKKIGNTAANAKRCFSLEERTPDAR